MKASGITIRPPFSSRPCSAAIDSSWDDCCTGCQRLFGLHHLADDRKDYYLVDVFRARLQYPDLRRKIVSLAAQHEADTVLIENAGPGMALSGPQSGSARGMARPTGQKVHGSKADRMVAQSAKIEAGHIYLPRKAEWLDTFLLELLAFPYGRHDDQVDSVSQFLKWAAQRGYFEYNMLVGVGQRSSWMGSRSIEPDRATVATSARASRPRRCLISPSVSVRVRELQSPFHLRLQDAIFGGQDIRSAPAARC